MSTTLASVLFYKQVVIRAYISLRSSNSDRAPFKLLPCQHCTAIAVLNKYL